MQFRSNTGSRVNCHIKGKIAFITRLQTARQPSTAFKQGRLVAMRLGLFFPVNDRGWTLDVLSLVQRLLMERGVHAASTLPGPATLKRPEVRAPKEFTLAKIYAFAPELEQLHPENRSLRTATTTKSASSSKVLAHGHRARPWFPPQSRTRRVAVGLAP